MVRKNIVLIQKRKRKRKQSGGNSDISKQLKKLQISVNSIYIVSPRDKKKFDEAFENVNKTNSLENFVARNKNTYKVYSMSSSAYNRFKQKSKLLFNEQVIEGSDKDRWFVNEIAFASASASAASTNSSKAKPQSQQSQQKKSNNNSSSSKAKPQQPQSQQKQSQQKKSNNNSSSSKSSNNNSNNKKKNLSPQSNKDIFDENFDEHSTDTDGDCQYNTISNLYQAMNDKPLQSIEEIKKSNKKQNTSVIISPYTIKSELADSIKDGNFILRSAIIYSKDDEICDRSVLVCPDDFKTLLKQLRIDPHYNHPKYLYYDKTDKINRNEIFDKALKSIQDRIRTPSMGNSDYWGDQLTLRIAEKKYNFKTIIINSRNIGHNWKNVFTFPKVGRIYGDIDFIKNKKQDPYLVLMYYSGNHYSVGKFKYKNKYVSAINLRTKEGRQQYESLYKDIEKIIDRPILSADTKNEAKTEKEFYERLLFLLQNNDKNSYVSVDNLKEKNLTNETVLPALKEIVNKIKKNSTLQEEDKHAFIYYIKEKNFVEITDLLNRYRYLITEILPKQLQEQVASKQSSKSSSLPESKKSSSSLLLERQSKNFQKILDELNKERRKTTHYSWWIWPTYYVGLNEQEPKSSLTQNKNQLSEFMKQADISKWTKILNKFTKLMKASNVKKVIPGTDHVRIRNFYDFFLDGTVKDKKQKFKFTNGDFAKIVTDYPIFRNAIDEFKKQFMTTYPLSQSSSKSSSPQSKNPRKHRGVIQTGGNSGRLRKGYKYTGRRLKNGKAEIVRVKRN
tara:strand:- start:16494 stop:18854 length:2361 start_codon:yes stop_codon:yes gene_type:complete